MGQAVLDQSVGATVRFTTPTGVELATSRSDIRTAELTDVTIVDVRTP
jgi:hypothetical protein